MEDEQTKKSFMVEHPRVVFWIRFVLWVLCAAVLPFLFIAYRFNIFKGENQLSLSGWGIIAVIIAAIFVLSLIRYVKKGFNIKNVFAAQCFNGICRVIVPLVCLLVIVRVSITNFEALTQSLSCTILCESMAIPINPMPKWVEECKKGKAEETGKDTVDYMFEKIFKKDK